MMDTRFIVSLPTEADNTPFQITSYSRQLRLAMQRAVRKDQQQIKLDYVDFGINNGQIAAKIRVFPGAFITREASSSPDLFFISGTGMLLELDGSETDELLSVGGQFFISPEGRFIGTLTIWRQNELSIQQVS